MSVAVGSIFVNNESKKASNANNADVQNIIGLKPNGSGSALSVTLEPHFEVEPSWNTPSFLFKNGTWLWLL